jgi:hypothetical protein
MNFCKDCKWLETKYQETSIWPWVKPEVSYDYARCGNPKVQQGGDYFVDGRGDAYAALSRQRKEDCGPEGRYWEAQK